ncbi:hypothetical protein F5Y19DRAFT_443980 [Xylariaceae sp. FL1651]|nr:hypothetical protein F5Y19DRAFT_443980 [Xylariaceae sp. FL1651]
MTSSPPSKYVTELPNTSPRKTLDIHVATSSPPLPSSAEVPATFPTIEPVVRASSPMPRGYCFVPKGNPYVTRNCRQQTQRAHEVVYAVIDGSKKQLGIRVPTSIYTSVLTSEAVTRLDRQQAVKKHDEALEKQFSDAILKQFPRMPPEELPTVIRRATVKHSGRVGRTGRLDLTEKVHLAVQAHIRHTKTDYDVLLRCGISRSDARKKTSEKALSVLKEWSSAHTREPKLGQQKSRITANTMKQKERAATRKAASAQEATTQSTKQAGTQSKRTTIVATATNTNNKIRKKTSASKSKTAKKTKTTMQPTVTRDASTKKRTKRERRRRFKERRKESRRTVEPAKIYDGRDAQAAIIIE